MRLGLGSYTYTWAVGVPGQLPDTPLTAQGLLDKAASLGVHVVQYADNLPLHKLSADELDNLERCADQYGISIEVGTRGIGAEHLRTYLQLAQRFHSPFLRIVIDTADHHPEPDEVVRALRPLMTEFEQAGVCLAIENHDRFRATVLRQMIEQIDSPFIGICLDTVNSFGALEGPDIVLDALGPYTVNLHVKDFSIRRVSHTMGFVVEGEPAGQGRLNVPWLLDTLRQQGRDPNAILELWTPPESTIAATVAKEDDWAKTSIRYLRALIPN